MPHSLAVLAVTDSPQTAQALRQQLCGQAECALTIVTTGELLDVPAGTPDLLLYELPAADADRLDALQALLARLPEDCAVFLLGPIEDAGLGDGLLQTGVRGLLQLPLDAAELQQTLRRALDEKRQQAALPTRSSTAIAFFNAHGSSGATLLAINTAIALARHHGARVALLDLDLQFGKIAHFLDLRPQGHVGDALRDAHRLDAAYLQALMCPHASGVQVLAAPPLLTPAETSLAAARTLIETAADSHDVVIADLPRQVSEWTLEVMAACDKVMLVTQNSLGGLRDTRRLMNFLTGPGELAAAQIEVVNNRSQSRLGGTSVEHMKKALGIGRLLRVRNDYAAALAAEEQGLPLYRAAPQSVLTEDCERLAEHLWRLRHPAAPLQKHRLPRWLGRLRGVPPQPARAN